MKDTRVLYLRYTLQCISFFSFVLLLASLTYPLGPEGPLLQWLSRLDPWALLSQLRWQQALPAWGWLPLLTVIATLLWGRIFCGWLCPFGALLAFIDRVGRAVKKRAGFCRTVLQAFHPFRYYWLLLLAIIFLLGSNWIFFFTPFALLSHEVARVLQGSVPWLLLGILVGTLLFSRLWCSALCPTGMLLSLAARMRLFGYQTEENCIHCGKCTAACSVGSAPENSGAAKEWCLACGSCRNVCPTRTINWRRIFRHGQSASSAPGGVAAAAKNQSSRRQFFKIAVAVALATAFWEKAVSAAGKFLRPPGALPEQDFAAVCNRCGRCIQVCPAKALWPVTMTDGLANFETPQLIPRKVRCDLCMACQEVCPTGAIAKVPLEQVRIGLARVDKQRCLAWRDHKLCFICGEQCPVQAIQGDRQHRPTVLTDKCVGCGTCENACPVDGEAAIRVFLR